MAQEVISAKIGKPQLNKVKTIIQEFKEVVPDSKLSGPKFGKIGDEILMSLKIDNKFYHKLLKILLGNDINVLFQKNISSGTKQLVDEITQKKKDAQARVKVREMEENRNIGQSVTEQKTSADKAITVEDVENLIKSGNYEEVLRISRSINCVPATIEKASESIADAARNAIELHIERGLSSIHNIEQSIKKLITIATDKQLRILNDISIMKDAGLAAVEVASSEPEYVGELIKIANNNAFHHSVTMKAVSKFAQLAFEDLDTYQDDLDIAVRSLSTRWINIAYDVAKRDMTDEEISYFDQLTDYIAEKR